jgi:hypothetical protein
VGGLLDHARKFFQGFSPAPFARIQRYTVSCPDGHRLTGLRTEGYQALRCPTCGEGVFVLPRSPLPEPAAPASEARSRSRPAPAAAPSKVDEDPVSLTDPAPLPVGWVDTDGLPEAADGDIEWVDEPEAGSNGTDGVIKVERAPGLDPSELASEEIQAARAKVKARVDRSPQGDDSDKRGTPAKSRPQREPASGARPREQQDGQTIAAEASPRFGKGLAPYRNRLLFAGVAALVVLTIAYRMWRSNLSDLPRVAELGRTEGLAALDEGRFDAALQLLSQAKRAVDRLGDAVEGASAIRQAALEIEIISQLVPSSLEALLDKAASSAPDDWADEFNRQYKGRSIIFDGRITKVPDSQGRGTYELDYRILRPGQGTTPRSVGRIDTTGFQRLEEIRPRVGDHVLIGARLASFRYNLETDEWLVGLEPSSGVTMEHYKALEALGWPSEADESSQENRP